MNTWFRRAVGTVGIASGVLLLGAGAAQAGGSLTQDPHQFHGMFDDLLSPTGGPHNSGLQLAQVHKGQLPTDSLAGPQVPGVLGALPINAASRASGLANVDDLGGPAATGTAGGTEALPIGGALPTAGLPDGNLPLLGNVTGGGLTGGVPGVAQLPTGGPAFPGDAAPVSDLGRGSPLAGLPAQSVTNSVTKVGRHAAGPAATVVGGRHRLKPSPGGALPATEGRHAAQGLPVPATGLPGLPTPTLPTSTIPVDGLGHLVPADGLPTNGIQSNDVPVLRDPLSGVRTLPGQAHLNGLTPADALSGVTGAAGKHRAAAHAADESSRLGVSPQISPAAAQHLPVVGGFLRSVPTSQLSYVPVLGQL